MKIKKYLIIAGLYLIINIILMVILYHVESSDPNASIKNLGDSIWYFIVTLGSVGYGDKYPLTLLGKFIGGLFVINCIITLSILISKVASLFSIYYERKKMGYDGTNMENHVVIIGYDSFAKNIISILLESGQKVAVIDDNENTIKLLFENNKNDNFFVFHAALDEYKDFDKVNIDKSMIVFVNLKNDSEKLIAIINLKSIHDNLKFMVSLDNSDLKDTYKNAGVTYVLSKNEIASKMFASFVFEPDAATLTSDLLSISSSENDYDIQQFLVTKDNPHLGTTYGETFVQLKKDHNAILIGLSKYSKDGTYKLHKVAGDDVKVELNDYLILINNSTSKKQLTDEFKIGQGVKKI